jgi:hypothetical protein
MYLAQNRAGYLGSWRGWTQIHPTKRPFSMQFCLGWHFLVTTLLLTGASCSQITECVQPSVVFTEPAEGAILAGVSRLQLQFEVRCVPFPGDVFVSVWDPTSNSFGPDGIVLTRTLPLTLLNLEPGVLLCRLCVVFARIASLTWHIAQTL